MLALVNPAAQINRRLEVFEMTDDTLAGYGIRRGDEVAVEMDEFSPGDFHATDAGGFIRVVRCNRRPPDLLGRVLLPARAPDLSLDPLPEEGMYFECDRDGQIVELDDGLVERCWGVEAGSLYGVGFMTQIAADYRMRFLFEWSQAMLAGRDAFQLNTVAERVDGLRVPLSVFAFRTRSSSRHHGLSGVTQPGKIIRVA